MKKIKVAQIGTSRNSHGTPIWKTLLALPELFDVVGYAFPEGEKERFPEWAKYFDGHREMTVEEILSDPEIEAVTVETEEIHLVKYAQMVADAGKHLHMEKPGSPDLAAFERLVDTLEEKGLVFSLGYMYRFNPVIADAIRRVREGELGEIFSVEAHMNCTHSVGTRQWLEAFPGGMLYFLGCHLIDLIYRIQGEPKAVLPLSCSSEMEGVTAEDFGMAVLQYPHGVSFAKSTAVESGGFLRRQLVINGERGTIEIRPLEVIDGKLQYTRSGEIFGTEWHTPPACKKSESFDRYAAMMTNFAELVRGKENPYTYEYERGLFRLLLRACGKE